MDATRTPARGVLALLCAVQFVLILDVAVVNVALVPMARDLAAAPAQLPLVASVYAACFGGLLLAGGRIADSGRRRAAFLAGALVFAAGSALCGLAGDLPSLVAGRGLQGAGAAVASPAALSLLTTLFPAGGPRERALGAWSAVAATGGAAGLLVGGLLTEIAGWRAVFAINPPLLLAVVAAGVRMLPPDGDRAPLHLPAGATVSAAVAAVALVAGTGAPALVVGALAAVAFAALDRRSPHPLVPAAVRRSRSTLAANAVTALFSAVVLGVNFFLALHLQERLGWGPLATGLAFLPMTAVSAVAATAAARAVPRRGVRTLLAAGMLAMTAGCLLLAADPAGPYAAAVLPGMLLVAAGMGPAFAVGAIAATGDVPAAQQGAAAAVLATATQVGAAIGLALLGAVATSAGTGRAYVAMAAAAVLAAAVAARCLRGAHPARRAAVHVPAHAAGCCDLSASPGGVRS